MGLFKRRRAEAPEKVEPDVSAALLEALIGGETITREKALTLPAVSGAVDFITNSIACMPVRLHKIDGEGKIEEVIGDPRVRMMNEDPRDTLDAFQMKKAVVADYLLGKGGYIFKRYYGNEITGLFYVDERYISIFKYYHPIFKYYRIFVSGEEDSTHQKQVGSYEGWEFIKLLRDTRDGASGRGVIAEVSKALETAYQTLLYQLNMVKTGGSKRGFLKSEKKLDAESMNKLKTAWANLYSGDSEKCIILNQGLDFKEASASSVEMQLNESKITLQAEINEIFHIYPNDFERTFKEGIYPIVKAFETALNRDLLLEKEKGKKYFTFDVKEIIKASIKERFEAYKLAKETGFITTNEIRRMEDMDHVEGLDVVNVGLGAVLYDINTHQYYTPNTGTTASPGDGTSATSSADGEIVDKVVDEAKDIVRKPLLVGQIQALSDIVKGYQTGTFTAGQAKQMLIVGVGLSAADAESVLEAQQEENAKQNTALAEKENKMLEGHVEAEEFDASGNSSSV